MPHEGTYGGKTGKALVKARKIGKTMHKKGEVKGKKMLGMKKFGMKKAK